MDIRVLRYFVAVTEAGSFSQAAQWLGVAQPALSRHLRALEARIGCPVFVRTSRGVILTQEGERLYEGSRDLVRRFDSLLRPHDSDNLVSGRAVIGLPAGASAVLARPLVLAGLDAYPDVQLQIIESLSGFLMEWLLAGRLDLAILYDVEASANLKVTPLIEEDLYLVGTPSALERLPAEVPLSQLEGLPLILPSIVHSIRRLIGKTAMRNNTALTIVAEADSLQILKSVAASERVFTVNGKGALQNELASATLEARRIVSPAIRRTASLVQPLFRTPSQAAEAAARLCEECALGLARDGKWGEAVTKRPATHRG